jgi:hypothetical protein
MMHAHWTPKPLVALHWVGVAAAGFAGLLALALLLLITMGPQT